MTFRAHGPALLISLLVAQAAAAQTASPPPNPAKAPSIPGALGGMVLNPKRTPAAPRGSVSFNPGLFKSAPAMVNADPVTKKPGERLMKPGQPPAAVRNQPLIYYGDFSIDPTKGNGQQGIFIVGGERPEEIAAQIRSALPITAETPAPEAPWRTVVAITYNERGSRSTSLCTGAVLDATHILTAGHCGCGEPTSYKITIDDAVNPQTGVYILAGAPIVMDQSVCSGQMPYGRDLALLKLASPFRCPPAASPARNGAPAESSGTRSGSDCRSIEAQETARSYNTFGYPTDLFLQMQPAISKGTRLLAFGYGYTETHSVGQLMQGSIPVASAGCLEPALRPYCMPYAEMVLSSRGSPGRQTDTCKGDSGGPVFLATEEKYTLVAVTSRPAPFLQSDATLQCGGGGIYEILGRQVVRDWFDANGVFPAQARAFNRPLAAPGP
jgi:hypothetical protein